MPEDPWTCVRIPLAPAVLEPPLLKAEIGGKTTALPASPKGRSERIGSESSLRAPEERKKSGGRAPCHHADGGAHESSEPERPSRRCQGNRHAPDSIPHPSHRESVSPLRSGEPAPHRPSRCARRIVCPRRFQFSRFVTSAPSRPVARRKRFGDSIPHTSTAGRVIRSLRKSDGITDDSRRFV